MENLRGIIKDMQDNQAALERHAAKSGYVSPSAEKRRHTKALAQLADEYENDLKLARTKDARREAQQAYNDAVKAENARHTEFFADPVDEPDDGDDGDEPVERE